LSDDVLLKVVEAIAGENGKRIVVSLLESETGKSDEELSNELNIRVNDVRRLLYELANHGFVAYNRSTRSDTRWHDYTWFTNRPMLEQAVKKRKREIIRILEERLSYEELHTSYICPMDSTQYSFDEAFENNFRCLKCGAELVELDNRKLVSYLRQLIDELKKSV